MTTFHEDHLASLLEIIGHDEDVPSSTSAVHCRSLKASHDHLSDFMPELANYVHKGVAGLDLSKAAASAELSELYPVQLESHLTFEHMMPVAFANLRRIFGMDEASYGRSIQKMDGGGTQDSGKSGSLFWFSEDKQILLKSITEGEGQKLVDILDDYSAHFESRLKSGGLVLLSRFYGLYRVVVGKESVVMIAMNNVFGNQSPERVYDIKGTTEDRYVEPAPGHVMKDLNYAGMEVHLSPAEVAQLHEAVDADSELLERNNIMDYSLLLGVYEKPTAPAASKTASPVYNGFETEEDEASPPRSFQMGIIDMLVDYSGKKIAAHWLKKLTIGCFEEIDTEPPAYYQSRFSANGHEKIASGGGISG